SARSSSHSPSGLTGSGAELSADTDGMVGVGEHQGQYRLWARKTPKPCERLGDKGSRASAARGDGKGTAPVTGADDSYCVRSGALMVSDSAADFASDGAGGGDHERF